MVVDTWTRTTQAATARAAENNGEVWSHDELSLLIDEAGKGTPLVDVAYVLGRTYYATTTMLTVASERIRRDPQVVATATATARAIANVTRVNVCDTHNITRNALGVCDYCA